MAHLSVGPFELDADIDGTDIRVHMKVGFHGISTSATLHLSLDHPTVGWNSPTVADFSCSLSLSLDEASGKLTASAKFCHPKMTWSGVKKHCDSASQSVQILPPHGLELLEAGLTQAGLAVIGKIAPPGVPSPADLRTFIHTLGEGGAQALKAVHDFGGKYDPDHKFYNAMWNTLSAAAKDPSQHAALTQVASLHEDKWIEIFRRCAADPTVQAAFPQSGALLTFPPGSDEARPEAALGISSDTTRKVMEVIGEIVAGIVVGLGFIAAALGLVVTIAFGGFAALGILAAAIAAGAGVVAACAIAIGTVVVMILGVLGVLLLLAAATVGILLALAIGGYLIFTAKDEAEAPEARLQAAG